MIKRKNCKNFVKLKKKQEIDLQKQTPFKQEEQLKNKNALREIRNEDKGKKRYNHKYSNVSNMNFLFKENNNKQIKENNQNSRLNQKKMILKEF